VSPLDKDYGTAIILVGPQGASTLQLGVLKALYETRPGFKPSIVTGISIGAITAAVLAGAKGDPIRALDRLWREKLTYCRRCHSLHRNINNSSPHLSPMNWKSTCRLGAIPECIAPA
jgi:predicted acylesterase/phospholipase RssA